MNKKLIALLVSSLLVACGSSDDDETTTPPPVIPPSPTVSAGIFIDSAVIGIGYRTATQTGVTNAQGEYNYIAGETVTFFIGGLEFPPTVATGVVTPLSIAATEDVTNSSVVNMARLLQTLDKDGDASNGITITQTAIDAAEPVDFSLSTADFAASSAVQATIENGGQDTAVTALISENAALEHLSGELRDNEVQVGIVGAWDQLDDNSGNAVNELLSFVFFDDGTYIHLEVDLEEADDEISGMEWGTYERDSATGRVSPTQTFDENGDTGLTDFTTEEGAPRLFAQVADGQLVFDIDEDADGTSDGTISFNSLPDDGVIGTWVVRDRNDGDADENDLLMFIFYNDGTYVHAEVDFDDQSEESGMEWGTYAIDSETNRMTVTQTFDSNGDTGLTDFAENPELGLFVSVEDNVLVLSVDEDGDGVVEETVNFIRQ
ncbi:hypothetical protein ACQKE0_07420 [Shewanella colwelliana]|uniref:hypothetical protein n=1 Tax=Shewanella colwelliana TaxID=23 RepID=UPI003D088DE3